MNVAKLLPTDKEHLYHVNIYKTLFQRAMKVPVTHLLAFVGSLMSGDVFIFEFVFLTRKK